MPALGRDPPFLVPFHFNLLFLIGEAEAALHVEFPSPEALLARAGSEGCWRWDGARRDQRRCSAPAVGWLPLPTLGALLSGPHGPAGFQ